jgi:hypothetical protein
MERGVQVLVTEVRHVFENFTVEESCIRNDRLSTFCSRLFQVSSYIPKALDHYLIVPLSCNELNECRKLS